MSINSVRNVSASAMSSKDYEDPIHYCDTQIPVKKLTYTWRIHNFSFLQGWSCDNALESPTFPDDLNEKTKWCLELYPTGQTSYEEHLAVYLHTKPNNVFNIPTKYEISILNDKKEKCYTLMDNMRVFQKSKSHSLTWGWKAFIRRDFLLAEANGLLKNDVLTIFCEMAVGETPINFPGIINVEIPKCGLIDDFSLLFEKKEWSDITIVIDGQIEVPAHKAILAARSPVFAAMFKHDMEEGKKNCVNISDMDHDVLREMLQFIYTGKVGNIEKIAADLLMAADKYALERLKMICEKTLCMSLEIENSSALLAFACLHNAKHLEAQAKSFTCLHMKDVMKTEGYSLMVKSHPELVDEVIHLLVA